MLAVDTYGTNETARLLGVSPKRVRQMVAAGQLVAVSSDPYRFEQQAVHALRDKRRTDKRTKSASTSTETGGAPSIENAGLESLIAALLEQTAKAARYEITAETNERLQAERDALASRVAQLEAELAARRRRGLFRRS